MLISNAQQNRCAMLACYGWASLWRYCCCCCCRPRQHVRPACTCPDVNLVRVDVCSPPQGLAPLPPVPHSIGRPGKLVSIAPGLSCAAGWLHCMQSVTRAIVLCALQALPTPLRAAWAGSHCSRSWCCLASTAEHRAMRVVCHGAMVTCKSC